MSFEIFPDPGFEFAIGLHSRSLAVSAAACSTSWSIDIDKVVHSKSQPMAISMIAELANRGGS